MKKIVIPFVFLFIILFCFVLYGQNNPIQLENDTVSTLSATESTGPDTTRSKAAPPVDTSDDQKTRGDKIRAEKNNPLLEWFKLGGPFMYPILILSIIALGVIIERGIVFRREKLFRMPAFCEKALELFKTSGSNAAIAYLDEQNNNICRILSKGLKMEKHGVERIEKTIESQSKIEVAKLERGLNILSAVGTIAPLLGFLGTVSGMIGAFKAIANAEQVSARIVASGIFEALITTAYGLIVAIPIFFVTNYFYHRVDGFAAEMEKTAEEIITHHLIEEDTSAESRA